MEELKFLYDNELTSSQKVLYAVLHEQDMRMTDKDLAELVGLGVSTVSRNLRGLENGGYIFRYSGKNHRRLIVLDSQMKEGSDDRI